MLTGAWTRARMMTAAITRKSEDQFKAFWEAVQADAALQEKIRAATEADAVVLMAREAGFTITAENLRKVPTERSDGELADVAGGAPFVATETGQFGSCWA